MKKLAIALALSCGSFTAFAEDTCCCGEVAVAEASAGDVESATAAVEAPEQCGCGCRGKGNK
jgi:hypothetical protein